MSAAAGTPDGRRLRWQEHNVTRRQVIVDAAIAVLEQQPPGEEMQVATVAEAAGMSRTVVYRHFADRADLDRAVQQQICEDLGQLFAPALAHDGTPEMIIRRLIDAFVTWAVEHPSLYQFADGDLAGWGASPLGQAVAQLAAGIEQVMEIVVLAMGVQLDDDDRASLDPWIFGLIGAVFAAVRRWLERDERLPAPEVFSRVLAQSIWVQVDGMARPRGLSLPDLPIADLLLSLGSGAATTPEDLR